MRICSITMQAMKKSVNVNIMTIVNETRNAHVGFASKKPIFFVYCKSRIFQFKQYRCIMMYDAWWEVEFRIMKECNRSCSPPKGSAQWEKSMNNCSDSYFWCRLNLMTRARCSFFDLWGILGSVAPISGELTPLATGFKKTLPVCLHKLLWPPSTIRIRAAD